MKVCTYLRHTKLGSFKRAGIFINETQILDINLCWQAYFEAEGHYNPLLMAEQTASSSLSTLIENDPAPLDKLHATLALFHSIQKKGIEKTKTGAILSFDINTDDEVSLDNPLDKINCYRDFYIHEKHVKKGFDKRKEPVPEAWYEIPAYYKGPTTGFQGTETIIPWPSYTDVLDYELELACVIGKGGKNISKKDAYNHIFGFTILNDISARDIQKKEMAIRLGPAKGKDFCSILGPVITTVDEFSHKDPEVKMQAYIDGELWSEGFSQDGHYGWAEMIEHVSADEWLLPTDVLGSGTVGTGCGLELDKWIRPGQKVELRVEKIGSLVNTVGVKGARI